MSARPLLLAAALAGAAALRAPAARAQQPGRPLRGNPTADSVVARIYDEGMHRSQVYRLAQTLTDSIGPRLTGSPANRAANDWLVRTYQGWGIAARNEKYGTWRDWTRGQSRVELLAPRARTLEATMLAWSPPTPAGGVAGDVVALPPAAEAPDSAGFARWLGTVRGKLVLASQPQPSCRPESSWARWASPEVLAATHAARDSATAEWRQRVAAAGGARALHERLERAGAAAILTSTWSRGWGVDRIFAARTATTPTFDVSCEDYGLLARLAAAGQRPRARAVAESRAAPAEAPVFNTVAEVRGSERPDEYVVLSAHLDSWDGASGATDNATGTVVMLEAMRILRAAYPRPKRTIVAGHWSGEEQGDIGSSAFAADHPEVLRGLQALFNQDNGTGQVDRVVTAGFLDAPASFARWLSRMPADVTAGVALEFPGHAHDESSDSDAFACRGAPAFFLNSSDWDYNDYTWHTTRDTFDKVSVEAVKRTATLVAMLAYQASEDPQRVSRERRVPPEDALGRPVAAPECAKPPRSWAETRTPRR